MMSSLSRCKPTRDAATARRHCTTSRRFHVNALWACLLCSASTTRADWPNFRGPRFDGVSDARGLVTQSSEPLKFVWERAIGSAFSSFAAVGDRIYTVGEEKGEQTLLCLDAATGAVIWSKPFEKQFRNEFGDGCRATPTVHDGRVYVQGAHGKLICVEAATGRDVWSHQFNHVPTWGYSGSVLIEGDLAMASGGDDDGAIVAFNKATGKIVWKTGDDPAGYSTPYPFEFNGARYVVGFTGKSAIVVEAKTGKLVWREEWQTDWQVNAAMPIFHDGHLFLSSGYRTGAALYRMKADGDKLTGEEVWRSKVLLNKFQSSILHSGHLYTSDEKALKCVEFLTGREMWKVPRIQNGTIVLADGHLYLLTEDGELQIAKADPEKYEPATKAAVSTKLCWSVPVIHQGRMYLRNLETVKCFDLRK